MADINEKDRKISPHKVENKNQNAPSSIPKILVVGTIFFSVWVLMVATIGAIPSIREALNSDKISLHGFSSGIIKNDLEQNLYFVPCDDTACKTISASTHVSDYNLITPGHEVKISVPIASNKVKTYGAFNEDSYLQGCVRFLSPASEAQDVTVQLSQSLEACNSLS